MLQGLSPVIAASAHWLVCAYPAAGGFDRALAERQARQAVTIAAWLRYPTVLDAELMNLVGPGGSARLDRIAGADLLPARVPGRPDEATEAGQVDAGQVDAGEVDTGQVDAGEVDAGEASAGGTAARSGDPAPGDAWRTWVDEVVTSWAACLLSDQAIAVAAVVATARCEHARAMPYEFRRLVAPDQYDRRAAVLLRHPDLLAPIANLHRDALLERLRVGA